MGRLERKIDQDLVDRILANGPIKKQPSTKSKKTPRPAGTYRAARRALLLARRREDKRSRHASTQLAAE